jgi:hypothetical protein
VSRMGDAKRGGDEAGEITWLGQQTEPGYHDFRC